MSKQKYSLFIVIIASLATVTLTQYDDYYEDDYGPDEYDYPSGGALRNYEAVQSRGIVDKFKGLFVGTKCILVCIRKFASDCGGLIGCGWNCMAPNEPLPEPDKVQQESPDDPRVEAIQIAADPNGGPEGVTGGGNKVGSGDIVRIAACSVQCLSKYLPRSKASLQRFLTCMVIRCFCDKRVNKSG